MIDVAFLAVLASVVVGFGWLLRRKHLQRMAAGPAANPVGIPGMARLPAGEGRWRMGRVCGGPEAVRWVPERGHPVDLSGARATGVRTPSVREAMVINPGSRILTCAYAGGAAEIAVMALDLRELQESVPPAPEGA
ncbi:hypothetical protein [Streptomyces sp. G-G2]|uniref:hypothetical protein n=1 Tax=Streptomyces sp. G-G2 TaxID=3046201 RepID=UPI0024BA9251|nr:hypothetical protein [Streptomyces sp. G-G2]MDJ0380036.1 hypothetical protein [Streptomyces sp. G-G2]